MFVLECLVLFGDSFVVSVTLLTFCGSCVHVFVLAFLVRVLVVVVALAPVVVVLAAVVMVVALPVFRCPAAAICLANGHSFYYAVAVTIFFLLTLIELNVPAFL